MTISSSILTPPKKPACSLTMIFQTCFKWVKISTQTITKKPFLKLQVCPGWSEKITFWKVPIHFKPWFSYGSQLSTCARKKNQPTCSFIRPLLLIRKVRSHLYNIGVAGSSFVLLLWSIFCVCSALKFP